MWDVLIYNYLKSKNIVVPKRKISEKNDRYEGAYVKEPQTGMHNWVMSFDLNSLYPHLIMQYNMSPDTHLLNKFNQDISVKKLLGGEVVITSLTTSTVTPNGAMFSTKRQGFLPELLEEIYDQTKIDDFIKYAERGDENNKGYAKKTDKKKRKPNKCLYFK